MKPLTLECSCFNIVFPHNPNSLSSCSEDNTDDVKTNKKNYFRCHFYSNVYVQLFTKEVNLFCG